jgi:galactose mutarotase-like enzyme
MTLLSRLDWSGFEAWALESELLRVVVVPELGAKLVSLLDKRRGLEWLAGPVERPLKKVQYGAVFTDQDMSGWDEMFPTIVACSYPGTGEQHGASLPDHGEVWTLPWQVESSARETLVMSVQGKQLPYHLRRKMSFPQADTLALSYELANLGTEWMPYMWAAHPQFLCGEAAHIVLPPHVNEVCNTVAVSWGWGEAETRYTWPEAQTLTGALVRIDRIGPPSLHLARKFFTLPGAQVNWAELVRQPEGDWLRLEWNVDELPYLGLWIDEGALNPASVLAIEPMTGFYDSLAIAWDKGLVTVLEPGGRAQWTLLVKSGRT